MANVTCRSQAPLTGTLPPQRSDPESKLGIKYHQDESLQEITTVSQLYLPWTAFVTPHRSEMHMN